MADGGILRITRVRLLTLGRGKHLHGGRSWQIFRRRATICVSGAWITFTASLIAHYLAIAVACRESDVRQVKALIIGP